MKSRARVAGWLLCAALLAGCTGQTYNLNPFVVCGPGYAPGYAVVLKRDNGELCQDIGPVDLSPLGSYTNPIYVRSR